MASEQEYSCIYCPAQFDNEHDLWDHIGAGSCSEIVPPAIVSDIPSVQRPIAPGIFHQNTSNVLNSNLNAEANTPALSTTLSHQTVPNVTEKSTPSLA